MQQFLCKSFKYQLASQAYNDQVKIFPVNFKKSVENKIGNSQGGLIRLITYTS